MYYVRKYLHEIPLYLSRERNALGIWSVTASAVCATSSSSQPSAGAPSPGTGSTAKEGCF